MKLSPSPTDLIDVHSHYQAAEEGVFRIYNYFAGELRPGMEPGPSSIGLHPWHIHENETYGDLYHQLYPLAVKPGILAIGEAGFDRHIRTGTGLQEEVFSRQVKLSEDLQKPMIIHCVKAFDLLLQVRTRLRAQMPWIIHGFQGNTALAQQLIEHGCHISLSERLLRSADKAKTLIASLPLNHLFIESDEDTLPVRDLYQRVAEIKNISTKELVNAVFNNFTRVFNTPANSTL
jgi:TatD DNase family protein